MTKRLYIHSPVTVVSGQVNFSFDEIYPTADIPVMSVTGDMGNVRSGMTVIFGTAPGLDDLGRQRIRVDNFTDDDHIYIGYSSRGTKDGEVNIAPEDYFTVLDERRVWSKNQRFYKQEVEPFVTVLKDYDLSFSGLNLSLQTDPKANMGPARAGNIDSLTGLLSLEFSASDSYSVPFGVGIVSYFWEIGDGTFTLGDETSEDIEVDFPAGVRYVALTVTDTNGRTHRMEVIVYARDPENDTCVETWQVDVDRNQTGQRLTIKIFSDLPRSTYPDNTVVLMFDDEHPDSFCEFVGWIYTDPMSLEIVRTGALRDTTLDALDLVGMLDKIPGQTISVQHREDFYNIRIAESASAGAEILIVDPLQVKLRVGDTLTTGSQTITLTSVGELDTTAIGVEPLDDPVTEDDIAVFVKLPSVWGEMYRPDMYMLIDFIARWHSVAFELADFILPELDAGMGYMLNIKEASAGSIYRQMQEQAHSICLDHSIGCNIRGQLTLRMDPILQDTFNRTDIIQADLNGHIGKVSYTHKRLPAYQWIKGGAILEGWTPVATTINVDYIIRATETAIGGATSVSVYPLPVDLPDGSILYLVGLGGQLLPWITLSAAASETDTTISVEPLEEQVEIWDEYQITVEETGPEKIPTVYCVAPGLTPSQGTETMTINNKIAQNDGDLASVIGMLWARVNSEWGEFDIDLIGEELGDIDPTEFTWVTASQIKSKYIPQRNLPFFEEDTRFLPLEFRKTYTYDKTGIIGSFKLKVERETSGIQALVVTSEDI